MARDAYGFSLNYFSTAINSVTINDYKSINSTVTPFVSGNFNVINSDGATVAKPLFNGNIASMFVNIPKLGNAQMYGYGYDQLNRIISMDAFGGFNNSTNSWSNGTPANGHDYKERVSYDANGNIKTYSRNGATASGNQAMDLLTYGYNYSGGKLVNNRLRQVTDAVSNVGGDDIKTQITDNYGYDEIGNLTKDMSEGINANGISWSVYGKILSITKTSGTITYTYDASGNRISKTFNGKTTWYVRDASGNVMAVYEKTASTNLTQTEVHLYGSSRLGIYTVNREMTANSGEITNFERGKKFFELSNHLGNVLVTVSDRKIQVDTDNNGQIDYYIADVISANDYYPFGMMMPGRKYEPANGYRYGFGGKEKASELYNEGSAIDYGNRVLDVRIGRWLSVDFMANSYSSYSPYNFVVNSPIIRVDINGDYEVDKNATKKERKALKEFGERYLRYLNSLMNNNPNGQEASALLSHSGYQSTADGSANAADLQRLINDFSRKGDGQPGVITLRFSSHSDESRNGHEQASPGVFYTHSNNNGGLNPNSAEASTNGNTITFARHFFELYKFMSAKNYVTKNPNGQNFNYDADITAAFRYINGVMSHEVSHWGWQRNNPGQAQDFTDATNTIALNAAQIQNTSIANNTWERGQHFEWAAYGTRLRATDNNYTFGAAINIHYRLLAAKGCSLSGNVNRGNVALTQLWIRFSMYRIFQGVFRSSSWGGGVNYSNGSDIEAGHH